MAIEIISNITIKTTPSESFVDIACGGNSSNFKVYDIHVTAFNNDNFVRNVFLQVTDTSETANYGISSIITLNAYQTPGDAKGIWLTGQPFLPTNDATIRLVVVDNDTGEKSNRCDFIRTWDGGAQLSNVKINGVGPFADNGNYTFQLSNITGNNVAAIDCNVTNKSNTPGDYRLSVVHPNGYRYNRSFSTFFLDATHTLSSSADLNVGDGQYIVELQQRKTDGSILLWQSWRINVDTTPAPPPPPPPTGLVLNWVRHYSGNNSFDDFCGRGNIIVNPDSIESQVSNHSGVSQTVSLRIRDFDGIPVEGSDVKSVPVIVPHGSAVVLNVRTFNVYYSTYYIDFISDTGIESNACGLTVSQTPRAELLNVKINGLPLVYPIEAATNPVTIRANVLANAGGTYAVILLLPGQGEIVSTEDLVLTEGQSFAVLFENLELQTQLNYYLNVYKKMDNGYAYIMGEGIHFTCIGKICDGICETPTSDGCCPGELFCDNNCVEPTVNGCCPGKIICNGNCVTSTSDGCCPGLTLCPDGICAESCTPVPCQEGYINCNNTCTLPTTEGCCPGEIRCSDNICRTQCLDDDNGFIVTHFECKYQKCVEMPGMGINQCEGVGVDFSCKCSGFMMDNFCLSQYAILGVGGIFALMFSILILKKTLGK